ncbi:MAG: hypothetical protein M3463_21235, partial [Verrucomicrobiota bacterium]|nr:hypothetical protein [Verrucomicrobiota bacterium]
MPGAELFLADHWRRFSVVVHAESDARGDQMQREIAGLLQGVPLVYVQRRLLDDPERRRGRTSGATSAVG